MDPITHYDHSYFEWQRTVGEFGAKANLSKFAPHIRATDKVIDFGCGGGYLLSALNCKEKLGIEVNADACVEAAKHGVRTVACADNIPDGWADVIISNSALEHTETPIAELRKLLLKLKLGGGVVFSIPHESISWGYAPGDVNQHLYTWSPMSAGNLFTTAGFHVERVWTQKLMSPPNYRALYGLVGPKLFGLICWMYRLLRLVLTPIKRVGVDAQIVVVARRPN